MKKLILVLGFCVLASACDSTSDSREVEARDAGREPDTRSLFHNGLDALPIQNPDVFPSSIPDVLPTSIPDVLPTLKLDALLIPSLDALPIPGQNPHDALRLVTCPIPSPFSATDVIEYRLTTSIVNCEVPLEYAKKYPGVTYEGQFPGLTCEQLLSGMLIGDRRCFVPTKDHDDSNPPVWSVFDTFDGWQITGVGHPYCLDDNTSATFGWESIGRYALCSPDGQFMGWSSRNLHQDKSR